MADNTFNPHEFDVNFKTSESPINQQSDIFGNLNKGYGEAIAGQETVPQLATRYNEQFGVPQMQASLQAGTEQYDALGNQIRNMPKEIAQRSQESILTQGQKNRQIEAESAPLFERQGILGQNLSRQQANLGVAQENASRMINAEQIQQEKELAPWLKGYETENIMSAMRMTGWTFENQNELTRLLSNQSAGITLSEGEKQRMNQLAIAEKGFQSAMDQIKESGNQARLTKKALPDLGTLYSSMFG